MLIVRDQARNGVGYTIAPLYELISVSARDVKNPVAENLQIVFSGWGAASLGTNKVWYDTIPPQQALFGDVDLAFIQGELAGRRLQIRLGRQLVVGGVAGALQLDGANVLLRLPNGFGVSGYVGSPVTQRFDERGTQNTFNPARGDFATGGRASWVLPAWGELGASVVEIRDSGDPSRRQVGGDLRLTPLPRLTFLANTNYDLYESRWAEGNVLGQYQLLPKLLVSANYRHVEPDLFLARNSVMAVFADDRRNEVGAGAQYGGVKGLTVAAEGYLVTQEGSDAGRDGYRAGVRATWRPLTGTSVGVELAGLRAPVNGYFYARAFASKQIDRITGTIDLQEAALDKAVNGETNSFIAGATLGYVLGNGFAALVSGTAGSTPYYEHRFDVMAKLAYNQSYRLREVR